MTDSLIINSAAVHGRRRRELEGLARAHLGDCPIASTEKPGDVERLAAAARDRGARRLVVAGGDGTVHEAANALAGLEIELAVVPGGSGNDYVRSVGIPHDFARALACAAGGVPRRLDAVDVTFVDFSGRQQTRVFVNIAQVGLGGEVVRLAERARRFVGRHLGYHAALAAGLLRCGPVPVRLTVDGADQGVRLLNNLIVANGQWFGSGMHPVPQAVLDDGLLDVVLIRDLGRLALARQSHLIHSGLPREHPALDWWAAREVRAESRADVLVEADGELLGRLPATFRIRPLALRVVCPR